MTRADKAKKYNLGGLLSEQIGITDEQASFWWTSEELRGNFIAENSEFETYEDFDYDDLNAKTKLYFKTWLRNESKKYANLGMKLVGKSHAKGGIAGINTDTQQPIEVEGGELILTKGVGAIKQDVVCVGTPEGISSELNEMGNGIKISDDVATCNLKTEIMEKGKKIRSHLIEQKIKRERQLKNKDSKKMEYGAKIENQYVLITEPEVYEIMKFIDNENAYLGKPTIKFNYKGNEICIYEAYEQLIAYLNKYGIHYKLFESKQELLDEYLLKLIPSWRQKQLGLVK